MARKSAKPHMSDDDRRFIYRALKKKFDFDEDYPLASLGWCFVREGINREDYGFLKLKPMLEEMSDFVSLSTKEIGGVSQSMFCLHEFEEYENDASVVDESVSAESEEGEEPVRQVSSDDASRSTNEVSKKDKAQQNTQVDKKKSNNQKDTNSSNSNDNESKKVDIKESVNAEKKSEKKNKVDENKKDKDKNITNNQIDTNNDQEKDEQLEKAEEQKSGKTSVRRSAQTGGAPRPGRGCSNHDQAEAVQNTAADDASQGVKTNASDQVKKAPTVKAAESERKASASSEEKDDKKQDAAQSSSRRRSSKAASTSRAAQAQSSAPSRPDARRTRRVIPGKALERFGYLGTWQEFLATLADLALDEPWDFSGAGLDANTRKFDILHNYIRYTFYRLTLEDKVGFSSDEDFAVFNTGLVDKHYEDIYACFEPSDSEKPEEARYPWSFSGFCTAGTGRLGKRLVRELNPLPQPASYLERKEDLLFDLDREVVCDVHHIVVDNVHRLPVNFLRDELASSQECLGILAGIEELSDGARGERFERLRAVIESDTRLFNRLSTSINAAIDVAKRQVRWNYKTAVPAYYPRTNSMNLLLPLILTDSPAPDVALVVELQKSGNYQGQTIVTMAQAYRDARLLCRPYIDWLSPASIIDASDEEDEEE